MLLNYIGVNLECVNLEKENNNRFVIVGLSAESSFSRNVVGCEKCSKTS